MYNIIATFTDLIIIKRVIKALRKNPKIRGHISIVHKDAISDTDEAYISSVLMKRSREIAKLKLDDTLKGIVFGGVIGSLSSLAAIVINSSLLHISALTFLAALAIIFYGGTVGAIIGLLISNMIRKYDENNFTGEMTLIIKNIDEETKDSILDLLKNFAPVKLKVY